MGTSVCVLNERRNIQEKEGPWLYSEAKALILKVVWQPGWMGGEFGGDWIHVYIWLSPFVVHLKPSQHC